MPWFDFEQDEIEAIATYVVGLVNDEVPHARMIPDADEMAMDKGLRVIRQKNCAACHVIEPGTVEFDDENGVHRRVEGKLLALEDESLPPPMDDLDAYLDDYRAAMREDDEEFELEELIVQLQKPTPGLGDVGSTVIIDDVDSVKTTPPWGGDFVRVVTDYYINPWDYGDPEGEGLVGDVDGESRSYSEEPYDKVRWTFAPPVLTDEGAKLQREWFYRFLQAPVPLRQQLRVHMPTFTWDEGEAGAVADYFAGAARRSWPERYTRELLLAGDVSADELSADIAARGLPRISGKDIRAIAGGAQPETKASFHKLEAYGDAVGFAISPLPGPRYDPVPQRAPTTLDPLLSDDPSFFDRIHDLVVKGPNCVQCHYLAGDSPNAEGPIAWAPDLDLVRERLRPDWVRDWLTDPSKIYPGTAMPANFPPGKAVWQEFLPLPNDQQIDSVLIWLYNLDRALVRN